MAGQQAAKATLLRLSRGGRLPSALMLHGPRGAGKLGLALALARHALCRAPRDGEPCGQCPQCRMSAALAHPDLHLSFPVARARGDDDAPVSDDRLPQWRALALESPYLSPGRWLAELGARQMRHYAAESDVLARRLALRPSQGGRRAVVVWLPELMGPECANKLLKLLEEPPPRTHFILVSDEPEGVLPTVRSRAQALPVPPPRAEDIAAMLAARGTEPGEALHLARLAQGDAGLALALARDGSPEREERAALLDTYATLMRACYARRIKEMRAWADDAAAWPAGRLALALDYFQRMTREAFALNFGRPGQLNYMTRAEQAFAERFAPFVNERNAAPMARALALCQDTTAQNGAPRAALTALAIKLTILLRR